LKNLVIFVDGSERDTNANRCLLRFQRISIKSAKVAAIDMNLPWMKDIEQKLQKEWVEEVKVEEEQKPKKIEKAAKKSPKKTATKPSKKTSTKSSKKKVAKKD
jgi:hypothetical protein